MKKITTLLFALLLFGCAGSGSINWDNARQIKAGMNESELTGLMGKPYSVRASGDTQTWIWVYVNGLTGAHGSVAVPMKNGKVVSDLKVPDSFK